MSWNRSKAGDLTHAVSAKPNQDPIKKTGRKGGHDRKQSESYGFIFVWVWGESGESLLSVFAWCKKLMGEYLIVLCAGSLALVILRDIWTITRKYVFADADRGEDGAME